MQDASLYSQIKAHAQQQQPNPQLPEQEQLKCPRCDSTNTKFCYYNNYNLSQPRYFCKSCKRYWTKGGTLRNIPVGGGSRKNTKRSSSSAAVAATSSTAKRPVPATGTMNECKSNNGEMNETLKGDNFEGQFGNFMEVSGSFSSLLGSGGGQFGNLLDGLGPDGSGLQHFGEPGSDRDVDPQVLESGSSNNGGGFLDIHGGGGGSGGGGGGGGDTGCWSGGSNAWPDLAMYTPRSTFQ